MKLNNLEFLRSRWFFFLSLFLIAYIFIALGRMVYQNWRINQQILNLEKEVTEIEAENQKLSDLIAYFQTQTFKEQEAREKLGLVMEGEKVLVIPEPKGSSDNIVSEMTKEKQKEDNLPNYQKWWNFFFSD